MTNIFKNLPKEEKPRERFKKYGKENLTNEELIAIILKTGTKNKTVKDLSLEILSHINSIAELKNLNLKQLTKINGVGEVKAIELLSAIELGKRIYSYKSDIKKININNPNNIIKKYEELFIEKDQERFYVIYLDTKNNILKEKLLFIGTLNKSLIHPREIFKQAYQLSSDKIICIHNHPSGDPTPSKEDIITTIKINEIAIIHGIILLDHIIIGNNKYYSFYENNNIINKNPKFNK